MLDFYQQVKKYLSLFPDKVYRNMFGKIKALDPTIRLTLPTLITSPDTCRAVVLCEGKTDGIHLKTALQYFIGRGEFVDLKVYFYKYPNEINISNSQLFKLCESSALRQQKKRTICLFDCDDSRFVAKCQEGGKLYKYWGNNLYSCLLPKPTHRDFEEICIEHFYTNEVLRRESSKHRRIYLSNEFDPITGRATASLTHVLIHPASHYVTSGEKMKKALIVTYYCADNYGAYWQAYALGKYVKKCGFDIFYLRDFKMEHMLLSENKKYYKDRNEKLLCSINDEFNVVDNSDIKYDLISNELKGNIKELKETDILTIKIDYSKIYLTPTTAVATIIPIILTIISGILWFIYGRDLKYKTPI